MVSVRTVARPRDASAAAAVALRAGFGMPRWRRSDRDPAGADVALALLLHAIRYPVSLKWWAILEGYLGLKETSSTGVDPGPISNSSLQDPAHSLCVLRGLVRVPGLPCRGMYFLLLCVRGCACVTAHQPRRRCRGSWLSLA